jgi:hypothetical protein
MNELSNARICYCMVLSACNKDGFVLAKYPEQHLRSDASAVSRSLTCSLLTFTWRGCLASCGSTVATMLLPGQLQTT